MLFSTVVVLLLVPAFYVILEDALALYQGPFLDGFHPALAVCQEHNTTVLEPAGNNHLHRENPRADRASMHYGRP